MKIGLIGYGKMGREIERIALERGHSIPLIIDLNNSSDLTSEKLRGCDAVIEFTTPATAVDNYLACFRAEVPVVSGTTGWLDRRDYVHQQCLLSGGTFFYASNFSVGVNLFFELNRKLAEIMTSWPEYQVSVKEIHHTRKLDAPSGTAISLATDLTGIVQGKKGWTGDQEPASDEIGISSERTGDVTGIHTITWESDADFIRINHEAKSRKGFALGAVMAAEFCLEHKGILTMKDLLKI